MAKKLTDEERNLIKEMCYSNTDVKIVLELNRIRRSLDVTEVVTIERVRNARKKMGLHKTIGIRSVVIKKNKNIDEEENES